uniref:Uncharacterized protein n=1 Tax=Anopheles atroparvus TaxID=41427 RepID=A0AAG5DHC4_ANOAO
MGGKRKQSNCTPGKRVKHRQGLEIPSTASTLDQRDKQTAGKRTWTGKPQIHQSSGRKGLTLQPASTRAETTRAERRVQGEIKMFSLTDGFAVLEIQYTSMHSTGASDADLEAKNHVYSGRGKVNLSSPPDRPQTAVLRKEKRARNRTGKKRSCR